jgi:phosphoribosylaminoimidazolecarboxamide formyltransferase/IMP cyclohydrolase
MTARLIRRALLSVSDKTGLLDLARTLAGRQVELISTGGTRQALGQAGLAVRDISEVTGFPEMLDGRVKTLHPHIHGGILAMRDNAQHQAALQKHGIQPIDLVVCNLYPFEATLARAGSTPEEIIENIDIGGPTLVRAAAKNYHDVAVLTDPGQYASVLQELEQQGGSLSLETRRRLAAAAFARIAAYDQAISAWFAGRQEGEEFPPVLHRQWRRRQTLRYGENPHQKAAFYTDFDAPSASVASAQVLHGKELSYNNILDLDSALGLVREFSGPAAVVIKHNNPCGAAVAGTLVEAFTLAYEGDPLSAFGGVLAFNREIDEATAKPIADPKRFIECIIAPGYSSAALPLLTAWKKNVRLLSTGPLEGPATGDLVLRQVAGGMLAQEPDRNNDQTDFRELRVVTHRQPTEAELADLRFAWVVCKHVKSNAIVLVKGGSVVGVGAGQMSRVDSVHMAARKAGARSKGAVLASDAFFPFPDNVEEAARVGVTALVQPGGSVRDEDSIKACDKHDLAMVFTGVRHFRH